jgi:hypothetical protein
MTKKMVVLAAALAASLPLSFALSKPVFAQALVQTQSPVLTVVTPETLETELTGDKPSLVILVGDDCNVCTDLAKLAQKYPQMKFFQGKASDFYSDDVLARIVPSVLVYVPGVGATFEQEKFSPADLEKFVAERVSIATRQASASNKVSAIREKIKTESQAFNEDLDKLRAEFTDLWKPYAERIAAERAQAAKAVASFEAQLKALLKKANDERQPILQKLGEVEVRGRAAVEADPEIVMHTRTIGDLRKSFVEAEAELERLKAKGVDGKDSAFRAVTDRLTALEKAFGEASTAYNARSADVIKPFADEVKALVAELEAVDKKFQPQRTELNGKIKVASQPFADEAAKILAEGRLMLKPHFDAVETVKENKKRALKPLSDELQTAIRDLEKALEETAVPAN